MPPDAQRDPRSRSEGHAADADHYTALGAQIDRAAQQFDACTDDACRRAWRAVLDELEERLPIGVAEPDR